MQNIIIFCCARNAFPFPNIHYTSLNETFKYNANL
jgi:hypothetical protein